MVPRTRDSKTRGAGAPGSAYATAAQKLAVRAPLAMARRTPAHPIVAWTNAE